MCYQIFFRTLKNSEEREGGHCRLEVTHCHGRLPLQRGNLQRSPTGLSCWAIGCQWGREWLYSLSPIIDSSTLAGCYDPTTNGSHLPCGKPQWTAVSEPGSHRDSGQDFSASGSRGYCWIVPYREVLFDELFGGTESRWVACCLPAKGLTVSITFP